MSNLDADITRLLGARPIPVADIASAVAFSAQAQKEEDLQVVVRLAQMDDSWEEVIAAPAAAFLPAWGQNGIDELVILAFDASRKGKTNSRALEVLLAITAGRCPREYDANFLPGNWSELPKYDVSSELQAYCSKALRREILVSLSDQERRRKLFYTMGQMAMLTGLREGDTEKFDRLLELAVDSHLVLNIKLIDDFQSILDSDPEREEVLQQFLASNPILLDPFTSVMYTKQELGSDFITDYVIRRMNDEYVLVEIENSTDSLFKQNGSFSADLVTALAQVRDFQAWISDNIAYAQKKLPNIKHPEGLVVIGRGCSLRDIERKRLKEENFSRRGHVRIVTYDDLLDTAKSVHSNLVERPVVVKSKETKGI